MAVVVAAYKNGRRNSVISALDDFPPYQRVHGHSHFRDQHHPFREQSFKTQPYRPYRYRPHRQDLFPHPEQLSLRDQMLLREYATRKNLSFYDNKDVSDFRGLSPFSGLKNQRNEDPGVYGNSYPFRHRMLDDRYSSYRQSFHDDVRFPICTINRWTFTRDNWDSNRSVRLVEMQSIWSTVSTLIERR